MLQRLHRQRQLPPSRLRRALRQRLRPQPLPPSKVCTFPHKGPHERAFSFDAPNHPLENPSGKCRADLYDDHTNHGIAATDHCMSIPLLEPLRGAMTLADQVAAQLLQRIENGELGANRQLPTELKMSEQLGVSRTVVREAVSRLKSMGRLVSRQGSGVFVAPHNSARALAFDPSVLGSMDAVLQVVEVRRVLEGEVCALAAERITPEKCVQLRRALDQLLEAVSQGRDGVEEDLAFHRSIARAADNPHFEHLLGFLEQYQREAMRVTRTNESMHHSFMKAVNQEHEALIDAITGGDRAGARRAAIRHMVNAAQRIEKADPGAKKALQQLLTPTDRNPTRH